MIRLRRVLLFLLLCLPAVRGLDGFSGDDKVDDPATGSDVWYFSEFDGSANRRWVVEKEVDPANLPQHRHHDGMAMYEVTRYPHADQPTPEQRMAADSLRERSLLAAKKHGWFDFNQAMKDGFHVLGYEPTHFQNDEFVLDDHILDPDRPEFLLYCDTTDGRKLAAFMFQVRASAERGPQLGGPLTIWHYHVWANPQCMLKGLMWVSTTDLDGTCPIGEPTRKSAEMMHVWFLDRPEGPFATRMRLSRELRKQLADRKY